MRKITCCKKTSYQDVIIRLTLTCSAASDHQEDEEGGEAAEFSGAS